MEWHPSGDTEIIAIRGGVNKLRPRVDLSIYLIQDGRDRRMIHIFSSETDLKMRILGTSPTNYLWSRITSDLGKMTTDKNWVKKKEYFFVFLLNPSNLLFVNTNTNWIFALMRMWSDYSKNETLQSFAFLVAGRYGIPTTGMNMAMSRAALIIIWTFCWLLFLSDEKKFLLNSAQL